MRIIDPDTPAAPAGDTPPADAAAEALSAMDQGIAEATPETPAPEEPPVPPGDDVEGGAPPGTTNVGDEPPPEGVTPPVEGAPDPAAASVLEAGDAEIAKGLKDKAKARFEELVGQVKELAPLRDAMAKAGIKDVADLPQLAERAKIGDDMVNMVRETGATPEQYGKTLDYLGALGAAMKGDAKAAEAAWSMFMDEAKALAAALGKEMPGVFDPIAEHSDLAQAVKDGDMPRERAIEVANARRAQALAQQARTQQETEKQQQQAVAQRMRSGIDALAAWEAEKLKDPRYMQLRPALNAEVAKIRKEHPPETWGALTDYAYRTLVASAAQPAALRPPMGPVRPAGPQPTMVPQFDDPLAALDYGIKQSA